MKIYAIEQNNACVETDIYFDFDIKVEYNKMAIIGGKRYKTFACKEYEQIEKYFDDYFLSGMELFITGHQSEWYNTISDLLNDIFPKTNGTKYSPHEVKEYKNLYQRIERDGNYNLKNYVCDILTLITGNKYELSIIRGYSQGDYAEVIHSVTVDEKMIEYIEACYFGTGTEFKIIECDDNKDLTAEEVHENINNYEEYYDYTTERNIKKYRQELAQNYNIPVGNVIIYNLA